MNSEPLAPGLLRASDLIRGLTPYPDAAALWRACKRGEFPTPVRDASGLPLWRREAIDSWRARRGLLK